MSTTFVAKLRKTRAQNAFGKAVKVAHLWVYNDEMDPGERLSKKNCSKMVEEILQTYLIAHAKAINPRASRYRDCLGGFSEGDDDL